MARAGGGSSSSSADYADGRDSGVGGSGGGGGGVTAPAPATAMSNTALWALYASVRIGLANLSPISDCDEVYNYWEPVHFLHYGVGMQTWEYAPQYALRTFAYLLPVASLSKLYSWMISILPSFVADALARSLSPFAGSAAAAVVAAMPNKPHQFRLLRSTLALCSALSELSLASSASTAISPSVASWTLLTSIASAGMFHASPAYLPSSTVMVLWTRSAAAQLTRSGRRGGERGGVRWSDMRAIEWGLLAVLATGWPFCGALFLTTGLRAVYSAAYDGEDDSSDRDRKGEDAAKVAPNKRRRSWSDPDVPAVFRLLLAVALRAVLLQCVVMVVDYAYYGRWVSPTLNIFAYNASGGGDELYGVEPLSYYVKNLLLNFNVVAVLGIGSLPALMVLRRLRPGTKPGAGENERSAPTVTSLSSAAWTLAPMYVWLLIVVPRPHKEERFLFPIYPALCLGAAWVVDELGELVADLIFSVSGDGGSASASSREREQQRRQGRRDRIKAVLSALFLLPPAFLSVSRSAALSVNYSAPLALYDDLYRLAAEKSRGGNGKELPEERQQLACVCGEWYRYPSSYHLPPDVGLGYLRSSFGGQLPRPFPPHGSFADETAEEEAVRRWGPFNDGNEEEEGRYVELGDCSYVIELVGGGEEEDEKEPPECARYMSEERGKWSRAAERDFLDSERTPFLHRVLYVPWARGGKVTHKSYALYERVG